VEIAKELLQSLGLRSFGPTLISCPTCGRCRIDMVRLVRRVQRALQGVKDKISVAIMGCEVNGPGEAREADVGLAAGRGIGLIFRKGTIVRRVKEKDFIPALLREIHEIIGVRTPE